MVEYQVRHIKEYSDLEDSPSHLFKVISYSNNFHTIKEAEIYISSLRNEKNVYNVQLFECKEIQC